MDYLSQPWLLSLIAVSICMAVGLGVAAFHIRRLYRVQHAMELIVKELIKTRDSSKKKFGELQSVSLGTGQKLIELERKLVALNEVQQEMSVQTPENKLYSRAVKMVELGAGIEEIMQECELPKAEAELLLSLHKHRSGN
ncbi:MAG: DUF2802 domain-containing protein [Tolumonas sp.]|nr:DUF2802 domain-containing protein [Tolumonas sp.]